MTCATLLSVRLCIRKTAAVDALVTLRELLTAIAISASQLIVCP